MQRRALNAKDCRRIKKQFSDISIDSAIRQYYAEKGHKEGMKQKAFEAEQLKMMIERFKESFNKPEFMDFFSEAKIQLEVWAKNKYSQNYSGALLQLQGIGQKYPSCNTFLNRWCQRQKMVYDYSLKRAEENNFEEV